MPTLEPGPDLTERIVTLPDGRAVRVVLGGDGGMPVVFEAGLGASASSWIAVQRLVAGRARTISYDRAGHGGSDDDTADRTLERMAADLAALLTALGITGGCILVGHSWGGPILRTLLDGNPELAAGIVLVDATRSEVLDPRMARITTAFAGLLALLARLGVLRVVAVALARRSNPELGDAEKNIVFRDFQSLRSLRTARRESVQTVPSIPVMRRLEAAGLPAEIPLGVVMGGKKAESKLRRDFLAAGRAEAQAHARGTFVLVEGVGHLVPQEKPGATARAVLDVLEAAAPASPSDG